MKVCFEAVPRRGYLVPEIGFHHVRELFEARLIVEGVVAELAAQRATDEEIAELERLATVARGGEALKDLIDANEKFHCCLAGMSRNRELARILGSLLDRTQRLMYIEIKYSGFHTAQFKTLHLPIARAIRLRDSAAARLAIIQDITQAQAATFGKSSDNSQPRNDSLGSRSRLHVHALKTAP